MIMRSLLTLMITATLTAQVSPRDQFTITDPSRALWKQIKDALLAEGGERYFKEGVKGALIPGGARRVTRFRGKVLAARPEAKPTELMVAILDPEVPDVKLKLGVPWKGGTARGTTIEFEGIAAQYRRHPFLVTLDVAEPQMIK